MLRLSGSVRTATNQDGGVVLDLEQGKMFRLNTLGATILEFLVRGWTEESIACEISERSRIDRALASSDVRAFLASLKTYGLLVERDPS